MTLIVVETSEGRCCFGWDPKDRHPGYAGGCVCWKPLGHKGRCKCEDCGSTAMRPGDWDEAARG